MKALHAWIGTATLLSLCSCASVPSGYGGVNTGYNGAMSELKEGVSFVNPLATTDYFDLRQQESTEHFETITADGAPIRASDSLVTFHVAPGELVALDKEVGPDYVKVIIEPIVKSGVRRVLSSYRWDQLDSAGIRKAQDRITQFAAERIRPYHIVVESVLLRNLEILLPRFQYAVNETGVWEQKKLQAKTQIELAKKEAERLRIAAKGIASAHTLVAPTLSASVLADTENKAWLKLCSSPQASVYVLKDKSPEIEVIP